MAMVELIGYQIKGGFDYLFNVHGKNGVYSSTPSRIEDNFNSHLLITPCWDILPPEIELAEGLCMLLAVINISDNEQEYAKSYGTDMLIAKLKRNSIPPIIDPSRESLF